MARRSAPTNPFYVVLVAAGILFAVTACAYGVMTFLAMQPNATSVKPGLLGFLDAHGTKLLGGELALLAVATVVAIGTDGFWERRALRGADQADSSAPSTPQSRTQP